ncbi:hypothetical protein ONZ51_g6856 [Trametes cubensis]|uniref:Methyltransferase n=1 Tax=Trametes cubensis TaxID=1111947 RepID=A0AAD7TRD7_9APHY|nr:hypothetical protein ONZ51_g6856 [Trametes cubensis]
MAIATLQSPHDVSTTLNYFASTDDDAPYRYIYTTPPAGKSEHNLGDDPRPVVVHDARGREDEFKLDVHGFQFARHVSVEKEFVDEERIRTVYYKEVEELLKRETGGKRVLIFDHTIRRHPEKDGTLPRNQIRGPVERVHIDQTYEASVKRVRQLLGADADRLLQSRVRLINVWRPIGNPVFHKPLAVGDWRSLDERTDLVPVRYIYPDREGATFSVRYNPGHRWWHLAQQTPEEVTLIKCYDSETDRARLTPHTAFWDQTSPSDAPHRQSIEIRALVFDGE